MRRHTCSTVSGEKSQVLGPVACKCLIDEAGLAGGAAKNSPETHPMPGDKNKEVERDSLLTA